MPQFDQETMVKLVSELRKNVARLQDLAKLAEADFLKDPDKIGSAKYHFIVAIESCIDMCNHVISRNGFRAPEDYGDAFRVMNEEGALEQDFSDCLSMFCRSVNPSRLGFIRPRRIPQRLSVLCPPSTVLRLFN